MNRCLFALLVVAALVWTAGCPARPTREPGVRPKAAPDAQASGSGNAKSAKALAAGAPKALGAADAAATVDSGPVTGPTISRGRLQEIISDGAQAFVAQMRVRPTFRRKKFVGWRLVTYSGPGPMKKGDIVCSVNGMPLQKPDEVMKAWASLQGAKQLEIRYIRRGKAEVLRYTVVD